MTIKQLLNQEQLHEFMETSEDYVPTISQVNLATTVQDPLNNFVSMPEYIKAKRWLQDAVKESERERIFGAR